MGCCAAPRVAGPVAPVHEEEVDAAVAVGVERGDAGAHRLGHPLLARRRRSRGRTRRRRPSSRPRSGSRRRPASAREPEWGRRASSRASGRRWRRTRMQRRSEEISSNGHEAEMLPQRVRPRFHRKVRAMKRTVPTLSFAASSSSPCRRGVPLRGGVAGAPEAAPARGRGADTLCGGAVDRSFEGDVRGEDRDSDFFEGGDRHDLVERQGARRSRRRPPAAPTGARRFPRSRGRGRQDYVRFTFQRNLSPGRLGS